jgi:hypothetical protein
LTSADGSKVYEVYMWHGFRSVASLTDGKVVGLLMARNTIENNFEGMLATQILDQHLMTSTKNYRNTREFDMYNPVKPFTLTASGYVDLQLTRGMVSVSLAFSQDKMFPSTKEGNKLYTDFMNLRQKYGNDNNRFFIASSTPTKASNSDNTFKNGLSALMESGAVKHGMNLNGLSMSSSFKAKMQLFSQKQISEVTSRLSSTEKNEGINMDSLLSKSTFTKFSKAMHNAHFKKLYGRDIDSVSKPINVASNGVLLNPRFGEGFAGLIERSVISNLPLLSTYTGNDVQQEVKALYNKWFQKSTKEETAMAWIQDKVNVESNVINKYCFGLHGMDSIDRLFWTTANRSGSSDSPKSDYANVLRKMQQAVEIN